MCHEERQSASVIDVRVRKHHGVDLVDWKRQPGVLLAAFAALALKQSAIQQHGALAHAQDMAGSGDFLRGAGELDLHDFRP